MKIVVSRAEPTSGDVYFIPRMSGFGRCDDHYSVVLLPDTGDSCLVLGVITSQVSSREATAAANGFLPKTIVKIRPSDYSELTRLSAVDCNSVKRITKEYFAAITANARRCAPLPKKVVVRLLEGIILSDNNSESLRAIARQILETVR